MKIATDRDDYLNYLKQFLPENPKVLEIGVEHGTFSQQIINALNPSEIHLLDPWEVNPNNGKVYSQGHISGMPTAYSNVNMQIAIERKYAQEISKGTVRIHRGYSNELVDRFEQEYFDFIYLDGCHLYESVKQDIKDYYQKVKPDGILGGHDYVSKEVIFTQQGQSYTNQLGYGIKQAVDEFLQENPELEMIAMLTDTNPFPDWAIRKKEQVA